MGIKYKIYPERQLLVDIMEGPIGFTELQKIFLYEVSDENFKKVRRILSDITAAKPNVTPEELQQFIQLMVTDNPDESIRWAIITSDPDQTALSFLIQEDRYFSNIAGVFSTLEGACRFLEVPFRQLEFQDEGYITLD